MTKYRNADPETLVKIALEKGEGKLSKSGALVVETGKFTGRSPKDKFIVDTPDVHDDIAWGDVNKPIDQASFNALRDRVAQYLGSLDDLFIFDGFAGADKSYQKKIRVLNEKAHQNLFIHNLLIRPTEDELKDFVPDYTIYSAPGFKCDPERDHTNSEAAVIIDYSQHQIVIAGTGYCGEIKKSVFSTMNFVLTKEGVLPMHCSANLDPETKDTAIFFGLSGTGKTTLSADPARNLIGDDEHGWSDDGVFNIEGGCYAKCIDLDPEKEPDIYGAIKEGSVVENVIMDAEGNFDFSDNSITDNTRVGYPIEYIKNAEIPSVGQIPKVVFFLTADAFGVLPPISKLTKESAMYHFITGFTSKVAGTEVGIKEPVPTFSTLFGEPFMPMNPNVYARMFGEKVEKYGVDVYLVNTGWSGGKASDGASRMALKYTRAMITAALNGELKNAEFEHHPVFNVDFPTTCPGVPSELLNPRETWEDKDYYDKTAIELAKMFNDNFAKKYPDTPADVVAAGPIAK